MIQKRTRSRLWFLIHSWLAMPIWAFLLFVCLTGTVATVSQEIVWLMDPAVRANEPEQSTEPLGYDAVLAAVERQSTGLRVQSILWPDKSQFALTVRAVRPDGSNAVLFVNAYTGVIQGEQGSFDFRQFMRALHGWLLMPFTSGYSLGWYVVSALSIPLLGSLITGLVVYKRFWRGFLKPRLRITKGARVFWGDFHRLAGIWSIPFIAIMSVTGGWFLVQAVLSDNHVVVTSEDVAPIVAREDAPIVSDGAAVPRIALDHAAAAVSERFPDLEPSFVRLPGNAYTHISVVGRGAYPLLFKQASVNPYTGKVEWSRRVSDHSVLELVTESMRPLHTGDFSGLWLKLVYFVFGLLLTLMVFSGMLVWSKRTAHETVKVVRAYGAVRNLKLEAAE